MSPHVLVKFWFCVLDQVMDPFHAATRVFLRNEQVVVLGSLRFRYKILNRSSSSRR